MEQVFLAPLPISLGYPVISLFFCFTFRDELQLHSRRIDAKLCERYLCPYFLKWGSNLIIITDFHRTKVPGNFQGSY